MDAVVLELRKMCCVRCKEVKPLDQFHRANKRNGKIGLWRQAYCKPCVIEDNKIRRWNLRQEVMAAYGSQCSCCGEDHPEFLTIDHIHGGGNKHRKTLSNTSSQSFYMWLKKNGFPKNDFRCLCANCNFSRGYKGYCPHEREANERAQGN